MSLSHVILYMLIAIVSCWALAYYLHDFTHIMFLCTVVAAILEIVNRMLSKVQN